MVEHTLSFFCNFCFIFSLLCPFCTNGSSHFMISLTKTKNIETVFCWCIFRCVCVNVSLEFKFWVSPAPFLSFSAWGEGETGTVDSCDLFVFPKPQNEIESIVCHRIISKQTKINLWLMCECVKCTVYVVCFMLICESRFSYRSGVNNN